MSKIKIEYTGSKRAVITLPPELILYITSRPIIQYRYVRFSLSPFYINGYNQLKGFYLVISNFYYDKETYRIPSAIRGWTQARTRAVLKKNPHININSIDIMSSIVEKHGRKSICNKHEVDYKIYEDGDHYAIVSYFSVTNPMEIPRNRTDGFYHRITDVFEGYHHDSFLKVLNEENNVNEFYHYVEQDNDGNIVYVTKDKFMSVVMNRRPSENDVTYHSKDIFKNNTRSISLSKLCTRLYPEHNPKILQAHLEYTKMLSDYDESLFSVVTGDDIVKYYHYTNYFKRHGDLGTSCMRHDGNVRCVEFYANNSNVSLIIMKPKGVDSIMARALLWTTVDGIKVMDRIYTCDSKLVSLFHKYAEQNNFVNIYTVRKSCDSKRNLTAMSPGNWLQEYDRNFIVDLDYLPGEFQIIKTYHKFYASYGNRRTSVGDSWKFPYLDNFNLINAVTKQASVLPIRDTFKCELTDTFVNQDNVLEYDGNIYNNNLVKIGSDGPTLIKEDIITLDAPDTTVQVPSEIPTYNGDWNDDPEEEELEWDELEDIVTQQVTNQNNV